MMDDLHDPLSHIFEDDDHLLSILDSLDDDIISPSSCTRSHKRQKISEDVDNGQPKVSHITVERNRRRQMNHQISTLRSLMPTFYVKRVSLLLFLSFISLSIYILFVIHLIFVTLFSHLAKVHQEFLNIIIAFTISKIQNIV